MVDSVIYCSCSRLKHINKANTVNTFNLNEHREHREQMIFRKSTQIKRGRMRKQLQQLGQYIKSSHLINRVQITTTPMFWLLNLLLVAINVAK